MSEHEARSAPYAKHLRIHPEKIRAIRAHFAWSERELGRAMHVLERDVKRWERDGVVLDVWALAPSRHARLKQLAGQAGISLDEGMQGELL